MVDVPMLARKEVSLSLLSFLFLVVVALSLGAFYRLPHLDRRPMHTDEAILGVKLGEFWETGRFAYDPQDYHGPALHQASWLWGHLAGWGDPATWTEADLRLVTALCGLGVLLTALLFADALGRFGTALAMLLGAVSPMMVYYSRYFIMEMLLVLLVALTLASFWRYSQGGSRLWLLFGGACLGLQHATKETFVLNVAAAAGAWLAARLLVGPFEPAKGNSFSLGPARKQARPARPWLWVALPALLVSVLAFSGGFRDWGAVKDSVLTYFHYLERSGDDGHTKPWHYYLTLLVWRRDTLVWSEALIAGLGVVGFVNAFLGEYKNTARQAFLVFLSVYTVLLLAVYSALGYKTPWSILSAQHALTLLAGLGGATLWSSLQNRTHRWIFDGLLGLGLYGLCAQTMRLTGTHPNPQYEYSADARNPYAYSHPPKQFGKLLDAVREYADARGGQVRIQVIHRDAGWPLPWYWRTWKNVGYQTQTPAQLDADVIIVDGEQYDAVKAQIRAEDYQERSPFGLRPGVMLTLFLRKGGLPAAGAPAPLSLPAGDPALMPALPGGTLSAPPAFSPTLPTLPAAPPAAPTPP